jgi:hypothetical protein
MPIIPRTHAGAPGRPTRWVRLVIALAIGTLAALYNQSVRSQAPPDRTIRRSDFPVQWTASRLFWTGADPSNTIGPGRTVEYPTPVMYPAPTFVALGPLSALPLDAAETAFVCAAWALLAYLVTRRAWWPLLGFAGFPAVLASSQAQWSPLVAAAALSPAAAWVVACKPSVGLAVAAYRADGRWWRAALAGGLALALVAFAAAPGWPGAWFRAMASPSAAAVTGFTGPATDIYRPAIMQPFGWLLLGALARWRRPEARLLLALGCVPVNPAGYELVPLLLLVPAAAWEAGALALASWAVEWAAAPGEPYATWAQRNAVMGPATVWAVFVPALLLILRRPNAGALPLPLDRWLGRVRIPAWVRGTPPSAEP